MSIGYTLKSQIVTNRTINKHALGPQHEQQSPNRPFRFNDDATHKYFGKQGFSEQGTRENVIQVNDEYLSRFDFDPLSIMNHGLPAKILMNINGESFSGADITDSFVLSEGDKYEIASIYPKPAGRYFDIVLDKRYHYVDIDFRQRQLLDPRMVFGLTYFMWAPLASSETGVKLLRSMETNVPTGRGFALRAFVAGGCLGGRLIASYLNIDPYIRDICIDTSTERDPDSRNDQFSLQEELGFCKNTNIVAWIKSLTIQGPHIHRHGRASLSVKELRNGKDLVSIEGAISKAAFNWFAFSSGVRNIAAGRFNYNDDGEQGNICTTPQGDVTKSMIYIPKSKLRSKPELVTGLSPIGISYLYTPHAMYFETHDYRKPS